MLAKLHRRRNDTARTGAICRKLLEEPTPAVVAFAAYVFGSQERMAEAEQALAMLENFKLTPGTGELVRGQFLAQHGEPAETLDAYRAAVVAVPGTADVHLALIDNLVRLGLDKEAVDAVRAVAGKLPDDEQFAFLGQHEQLLHLAGKQPEARPLIVALLADTPQRAVAVQVLAILRDAEQNESPCDEVALKLDQLAEEHPQFGPLQILSAKTYLALDRPNDVARVATRTMQVFPNDVDPAWIAAEAMAAAGRWPESLGVATEWRLRSQFQPVAADLAIANRICG